jgi:hypothetical protein
MTKQQQRILDVLNSQLAPWSFTGDEPFVLALFQAVKGECSCPCHKDGEYCDQCCDGGAA